MSRSGDRPACRIRQPFFAPPAGQRRRGRCYDDDMPLPPSKPPPIPPAIYSVPRRFNLPAVFVMTTLLAIVCGILKAHDAREEVYIFLAVMTAVTCAAQIYTPRTPRVASAIGGVVTLVIMVLVIPWRRRRDPSVLEVLLFSVPVGALLGYIVGTMAASVFLVTDRIFGRRPPG